MPQTLLAILALMLTITYSSNVMQRHVGLQHTIISRELEEMAASIAVETMEIIRARQYDVALASVEPGRILQPSDFRQIVSSENHFQTGRQCFPFVQAGVGCEYIDDFHKAVIPPRTFRLGDQQVHFEVDVTVEYVDATITRASSATMHKMVTVKVRDVWPGSQRRFLTSPIQISRVFSYTS